MLIPTLVLFLSVFSSSVQSQQTDVIENISSMVQNVTKGILETFLNNDTQEFMGSMANTLATTTLEGCKLFMPESIDIPSVSTTLATGTLTADDGKVYGLSTVQLKTIGFSLDDSENLLISIPITFSDLHISYDQFKVSGLVLKVTGKADLKVKDNQVTLNAKIVKMPDALGQATSGECVLYVKSLTLAGLQDMEPTFTVDGSAALIGNLTSTVLPVLTRSVRTVLLKVLNTEVTSALYDALPASGAWVCRTSTLTKAVSSIEDIASSTTQLATTLVNSTAQIASTLVGSTAKVASNLVGSTGKVATTLANSTAQFATSLAGSTGQVAVTAANSTLQLASSLVGSSANVATSVVNSTAQVASNLVGSTTKIASSLLSGPSAFFGSLLSG